MSARIDRLARDLAAKAAKLEVPRAIVEQFGPYRDRPLDFCREVLGTASATRRSDGTPYPFDFAPRSHDQGGPMRLWLASATLLALVCCVKSEATKQKEVGSCSSITSDAQALAQCLVMRYKWDGTDALPTAMTAQHEKDSLALSLRARLEDSVWLADSQKHLFEISQCHSTRPIAPGVPSPFVVARCLQVNFSWPEGRAVATEDSIWQLDSAKHRQEVARCAGRESPAACLDMNYGWPSDRSIAVDESLSRARFDQSAKQPRSTP